MSNYGLVRDVGNYDEDVGNYDESVPSLQPVTVQDLGCREALLGGRTTQGCVVKISCIR
jgi:hypothetical protein